MVANADRKEYPISMRLPEADVAMIDRAATLRGRSRTDFVRDAAVRAAEEVVMEQSLIRMSPEGSPGSWRFSPPRQLRFRKWSNWPGGRHPGKPVMRRSGKSWRYRLPNRSPPRMTCPSSPVGTRRLITG